MRRMGLMGMHRGLGRTMALLLLAGSSLHGGALDSLRHAGPVGRGGGRSAWEVGLQLQNFKYVERGVMSEKGELIGPQGSWTLEEPAPWVWRMEGSFVYGELQYDGAVVSLVTGEEVPARVDTPNSILNLRALGGRLCRLANRDVLPYAGIAYRLLVDDLPGDSGYRREQSYIYVPIGIEVTVVVIGPWTVGLQAEYDLFIRGENNSESDLGGIDANLEQDSGEGFRASLHFERSIKGRGTRPVGIVIEPFFEYWDVDESDPDTDLLTFVDGGESFSGEITYFEPANNTKIYGLRAGFIF